MQLYIYCFVLIVLVLITDISWHPDEYHTDNDVPITLSSHQYFLVLSRGWQIMTPTKEQQAWIF